VQQIASLKAVLAFHECAVHESISQSLHTISCKLPRYFICVVIFCYYT